MPNPFLLPCPFCGSTGEDVPLVLTPVLGCSYLRGVVECWNCGAKGPSPVGGNVDNIVKTSVEGWNRRSDGKVENK